MKRILALGLNLLALAEVVAFGQTPPAGYVSMPKGVTCLGYNTMQSGQEGTGWALQSIGSLRCGTFGANATNYKEVALASHDVTGGRIQTSLFGTFVVLAQPAVSGSSTMSGAGVEFGPGGTVTPLSTDERPSTYAANQGATHLQLAISQGAVQALSVFLQGGSLPTVPIATSPAPAATSIPGPALRVASINFQQAVAETDEVKRAISDLRKKYEPERQRLLALDKTKKTTQDDLEAAGKRFQADASAIYGRVAAKVGDALAAEARQQGFDIVIDMGSNSPSILYTSGSIPDIRAAVVDRCNKNSASAPSN